MAHAWRIGNAYLEHFVGDKTQHSKGKPFGLTLHPRRTDEWKSICAALLTSIGQTSPNVAP